MRSQAWVVLAFLNLDSYQTTFLPAFSVFLRIHTSFSLATLIPSKN